MKMCSMPPVRLPASAGRLALTGESLTARSWRRALESLSCGADFTAISVGFAAMAAAASGLGRGSGTSGIDAVGTSSWISGSLSSRLDQPLIGCDQRHVGVDEHPAVFRRHLNIEMEMIGGGALAPEEVADLADDLALAHQATAHHAVGVELPR